MVLVIRHGIPTEFAEQMTADSLFIHAVDEGWIGKQGVIDSELSDIAVSEMSATGVHIYAGKESPIKWVFQKEADHWKIDLTSIMSIGDQAMKQSIRQSNLSEEEFLASILESVSGKKVADTVWQPMIE